MTGQANATVHKKIGIAAVVIVGILMARISWLKWPDLIVDFGREAYIPWQLLEGSALYSDINYWNGPLSPYLNSFFFKLFGSALFTLEIINIIVIAAIAFLLYRIFDEPCGERSGSESSPASIAAMISITFLTLFAFSQYLFTGNFNFAAPYSHELTHGTLIALVAIFSLRRFHEREESWLALVLGLLVGLSLLTKVEITLSVTVAIGAAFCLSLLLGTGRRRRALFIGLFIIGIFLPLVVALACLSPKTGFASSLEGIFGSWIALFTTDVGGEHFQRASMGTDMVWKNIGSMFLLTCGYAVWIIATTLLCRLLAKGSRERRYAPYVVVIITAVVALLLWNRIAWFELLRPLPLVAIAAAILIFIRTVRGANDRQKEAHNIQLFAFAIFSLLMLLKIFLNVHVYHYGFALAMPATMLMVYALLRWLPTALGGREGAAGLIGTGLTTIIIATIAWHALSTAKIYERKTLAVGSGKDVIMTFSPHERTPEGEAVLAALKVIDERVKKDATMLVLPEGIMLNFLSKRVNPTGFVNFVPSEVTIFGEERMIEAFTKSKPDYVLLVDKDTSDYGARYFGTDYGLKISKWVRDNYREVELVGKRPLRGEGFGILFLKRKK